jgi:hypothetical protein
VENIAFREADSFTKSEVAAFRQILMDAGEVSETSFAGFIEKNPRILFQGDTKSPDGIGALKIPNRDYKDSAFQKAKSPHDPASYRYELGWVVSLVRGSGNKIVAALATSGDTDVYATVRENNPSMIHLLRKYGFVQSGIPYAGRGNYKILLFIKPL